MTSIYRKVKTANVFPDGDGGFRLRLIIPTAQGENELVDYDLTPRRCARLIGDIGRAIGYLLPEEKPHDET